MFEIHKSKRWDAYDKNCSFYEHTKLSFFTFKIGYETGTEFIVLWCQFVCLGLLTPCYWGEVQRLGKCQVILHGLVSPIYWEVLTKKLGMMEDKEDVEESLTHKLTSRVGCHEIFWPHDSNAIFEG